MMDLELDDSFPDLGDAIDFLRARMQPAGDPSKWEGRPRIDHEKKEILGKLGQGEALHLPPISNLGGYQGEALRELKSEGVIDYSCFSTDTMVVKGPNRDSGTFEAQVFVVG